MPACVTLQAVGQVPNNHPLYIGMYGWFGPPVDKAMFDQADLILTIGLDGWDIVRPYRAKVPIVSLDCVDANDRTFQPVTVGLVGDLGAMLRALAAKKGRASATGAPTRLEPAMPASATMSSA